MVVVQALQELRAVQSSNICNYRGHPSQSSECYAYVILYPNSNSNSNSSSYSNSKSDFNSILTLFSSILFYSVLFYSIRLDCILLYDAFRRCWEGGKVWHAVLPWRSLDCLMAAFNLRTLTFWMSPQVFVPYPEVVSLAIFRTASPPTTDVSNEIGMVSHLTSGTISCSGANLVSFGFYSLHNIETKSLTFRKGSFRRLASGWAHCGDALIPPWDEIRRVPALAPAITQPSSTLSIRAVLF